MDISKCNGKDCLLRNTCLRFLVKATHSWQTHVSEKFIDGRCEDYLNKDYSGKSEELDEKVSG